MCVVYLLESGSKARKNGGRLVIEKNGECVGNVPVRLISQMIIGTHSQITTQTLCALLKENIQITYIDNKGIIQGILTSPGVNADKLLLQAELFKESEMQKELVKYVIAEKLKQQRLLVQVYARRKKNVALKTISEKLKQYMALLNKDLPVEEMRGIEGLAARTYFNAFPVILNNDVWQWKGRNRRPPKDGINVLLSYGYSFLEREVRIAIAGAGLDCRIGFLHTNNGRKDSLVYDLMELFRQVVIDRMVIKLLNYNVFSPIDFVKTKESCFMTETARTTWLTKYEKYMETETSEFGGISARTYIRNTVQKFAVDITNRDKVA